MTFSALTLRGSFGRSLLGIVVGIGACACGTAWTLPDTGVPPAYVGSEQDVDVPVVSSDPIESFTVTWKGLFPPSGKRCRSECHADYNVAVGQGNYVHGCVALDGNGYLEVYEARAIALNSDQQGAMQKTLVGLPLAAMADRYFSDGQVADLLTFGLDLQTASVTRHISVHASKTIKSPPLIQLFELLAEQGFLGRDRFSDN